MKLLKQYQKMHQSKKNFNGRSLKPHAEKINHYIEDLDLVTLLDYGSGKAKFHKKLNAVVTPYDPAVPEFQKLPDEDFDGVICTDVLEHVPEDELDDVLTQIFNRARYFVYFSISTKPAKKTLPNGENAHCTIKPEGWWEEYISEYQTSQVVSINFD